MRLSISLKNGSYNISNLKKAGFFGIGLIFLMASYSFLSFLSPAEAIRLTQEDGLIENISAICWFFSAIIMYIVFIKSKSDQKIFVLKTNRNIFYLLLGLFFIFCLGEEISWGQRIFGVSTPEMLLKLNAQGEINLHNLSIFHENDKNMNDKLGLLKWITSGRIFSLFWFFFCVLIPLLNEYSLKARRVFGKFLFPVIPVWIGVLFLMNHIISRFFGSFDLVKLHILVETKETVFAFLFLITSIALYYLQRQSINKMLVNS
jgi:hypothetical protein